MNMHELGMNMAWTVHEVTMIVGIKSMKYGPKFPNFMGVARESVLSMKMGMYMPKNHYDHGGFVLWLTAKSKNNSRPKQEVVFKKTNIALRLDLLNGKI